MLRSVLKKKEHEEPEPSPEETLSPETETTPPTEAEAMCRRLTPAAESNLSGGAEMDIRPMSAVIAGKRYRTEGAELLASDAGANGRGAEQLGRNTFLFRTAKGNYFMQFQTTWSGEQDAVTPLARDEALRVYEALPGKALEYEEAFPGIQIEDA